MGKGCRASGPRSWMISDELVQGSPAGVSASFSDRDREGGGSGIFIEETSDRRRHRCGSGSLFSPFLPTPSSPYSCLEETPR